MASDVLDSSEPETKSPLEAFLRDYADTTGGLWEEVEPQVYDLMFPPGAGDLAGVAGGAEVVRVTFDPEALAEHPGVQLATYGTPLVERLLGDAVTRGRHAELYFVGLNVAPQGLADRAARALTLPEGAALRVERVRVLHFPQALFWFEATFLSDQKEQELLPVSIDLHYGRQVRHLERLLDRNHLAPEPWAPLPEARHLGLEAAYPIARDRVVRTVAALANTRSRELFERLGRQVARMRRYYGDLRAEVDEQAQKASKRGEEDQAKFASRREMLQREEQLRIGELRQKSSLKVHLRLINLLKIHQPKLLVQATVHRALTGANALAVPLELVWDPLVEGFEAVSCPSCGHPTFILRSGRPGTVACPDCETRTPPAGKPERRRAPCQAQISTWPACPSPPGPPGEGGRRPGEGRGIASAARPRDQSPSMRLCRAHCVSTIAVSTRADAEAAVAMFIALEADPCEARGRRGVNLAVSTLFDINDPIPS